MMTDVGQAYDVLDAGLRKNPTLRQIWREHALGAAYPERIRASQL
jgi:hypothetical protein